MIDRFGREGGLSHGNLEACGGERWCNGTLKGITSHLDYISGWLR
jgi:glycosidase